VEAASALACGQAAVWGDVMAQVIGPKEQAVIDMRKRAQGGVQRQYARAKKVPDTGYTSPFVPPVKPQPLTPPPSWDKQATVIDAQLASRIEEGLRDQVEALSVEVSRLKRELASRDIADTSRDHVTASRDKCPVCEARKQAERARQKKHRSKR